MISSSKVTYWSVAQRRIVPTSTAAETKQQRRQISAVAAQRAVALDDRDVVMMHQTSAARRHARTTHQPGQFGAAVNRGKDFGVQFLDLDRQLIDQLVDVGGPFRPDVNAHVLSVHERRPRDMSTAVPHFGVGGFHPGRIQSDASPLAAWSASNSYSQSNAHTRTV